MDFTLNGRAASVEVHDGATVLDLLREECGLTSMKDGCAPEGSCGACTVLLDGVPHYACSILSHQVRGREVMTIEGLAQPGADLHPVQQAVFDETGFQCAFCASGFIMAMVGMLKVNPNPTREEAAHALSGNICRCGDYNKILNSAMRAAQYMGATT